MSAGISIIAVGDLHQLPPIQQKPIFCRYGNDVYNLSHPWHKFKMIELVEIMRQKDDQPFIELLNRVRVAQHTDADKQTIQSRAIDVNDKNNYPLNELHAWAENKPVMDYNNQRLQEILMPLHVLQAVVQYPKNVSRHEIERVLSKGRSYTGGLDLEVCIKSGARVMLTNNVDISDRLINGQLGTVARITVNEVTQKPSIVYIKFDDEVAGNLVINKSADIFAIENKVVPIKPVLAQRKLNPGKRSSPEIQRLQFPLALAWACTVHKNQGLTLNKIVISFELFKQRSFNYGQIYVALSCTTSLQASSHFFFYSAYSRVKVGHVLLHKLRNSSFSSRPVSVWTKHAYVSLFCPFAVDLTVAMDVEINPCPNTPTSQCQGPDGQSQAMVPQPSGTFEHVVGS